MIGYGLIGLGGIARTHLQALKCMPVLQIPIPEVKMAALLTTDPGKADHGRDLGFACVEHDLESFLAAPGLDAVDICTPNNLHGEQIMAAVNAGKHIYFEKPLALNGEEALALGAKLAGSKLIIQGAYVLRFQPSVARARAMIAQGLLGRIHSFRFELYHSSYLNPEKTGTWRLQKSMSGGGALMDLGCHMLDLVRFMLGEAVDIQAWTDTVVDTRKFPSGEIASVDVDDHALVVLGLKSGARGSVEVSRVAVGGERMKLEIYGSKGAVHISSDHSEPCFYDSYGQRCSPEVTKDIFMDNLQLVWPAPKLSMGWMLDAHAASLAWFLRAVDAGSIPDGTPNLIEAIKTQVLVEDAYNSTKNTNKFSGLAGIDKISANTNK